MSTATAAPDPNRWRILGFVGLAQLMAILDGTIMNIALPSAQRDLGLSETARSWPLTAYLLAFGGLLLLGGRIGDTFGRRRTFLTGLVGFALASALGGAASDGAMMIVARAAQGAMAALLAPAALSVISVAFSGAHDRAKAFGVFGALASSGSAVGLLLGGALTDYLDWRWDFYVNVPIAAVAAVGTWAVLRERPDARHRTGFDVPGLVLSLVGIVSLVYGFNRAQAEGWSAPLTLTLLLAAVVLLGLFVLAESRSRRPLLPLRVLADRNRAGVYLSVALSVIAVLGMNLCLTYYFQTVHGDSPMTTGLEFLPQTAGILVGATQLGPRAARALPMRLAIGPGFLLAGASLWVVQLGVGSDNYGLVLPSLFVLGLGLGVAWSLCFSVATHGVDHRDIGVASAVISTSQQVGGSVGTSLLNTVAASATTSWLASHHGSGASFADAAAVHGYVRALLWAVGALVLAGAVSLASLTITKSRPTPQSIPAAEETAEEAPLTGLASTER